VRTFAIIGKNVKNTAGVTVEALTGKTSTGALVQQKFNLAVIKLIKLVIFEAAVNALCLLSAECEI
jgi:hypothetical protein